MQFKCHHNLLSFEKDQKQGRDREEYDKGWQAKPQGDGGRGGKKISSTCCSHTKKPSDGSVTKGHSEEETKTNLRTDTRRKRD